MKRRFSVCLIAFLLALPLTGAALPPTHDIDLDGRRAWRQVLAWPQDCEDAYPATDPATGGIVVRRLRDHSLLIEVACALGAYQGSQLYYRLDEAATSGGPSPLLFPIFEDAGENKPLKRLDSAEIWGAAEFDPRRQRLSVLNRYRGSGDCGSLATYSFARGGVRLTELRAKRRCDGRGAEQPQRWPRVRVQ